MTELQQLIEQGQVTDPNSPRGRLLAAAARLFKEKGFARTTVRDIAAEVGILSGSIFHHFPNKESILKEVMAEAIRLAMVELQAAVADMRSVADKVRAVLRCELEAIHGQSVGVGFTLLAAEWRYLSEESQADILKLRDRYESFHRDIYQEAKDQGLIKVEPFYLRHFVRGALGETIHWFHLDGDLSLEGLVEQIYLTAAIKA